MNCIRKVLVEVLKRIRCEFVGVYSGACTTGY